MTDKLFGVNNLEIDKENCKLFIEEKKNKGVEIDLNIHELMHLIESFTDEDVDVAKEIYGLDTPEWVEDE